MVYDLTRLERESALTLALFFGLLALTLVLLAAMLNLLLTRSVLRPVSVLRNAMRRVQAGRLGETVPLSKADEIGEMAAAFNEMSTRLYQQRKELLQSIRDRDKYFDRLEKSNRELEALNVGLEGLVEERTQRLRQRNERLRQEIRERRRAALGKRCPWAKPTKSAKWPPPSTKCPPGLTSSERNCSSPSGTGTSISTGWKRAIGNWKP
jgi:HAMP domain-containing protein